MDRVELRNLLLHPKQIPNVLRPMGYNPSTYRAIVEVLEGALDYEQKKGRARLIAAVEELKKMKGGNE